MDHHNPITHSKLDFLLGSRREVLIMDAGISSYYGGRGASLLSANDQLMLVQQTKLVNAPRGHLPMEYLQRLVGHQPNVPAALRQLMNAISESS